ncbi:FHA domain-containing protein, partial [Jannaschia pohangensis]
MSFLRSLFGRTQKPTPVTPAPKVAPAVTSPAPEAAPKVAATPAAPVMQAVAIAAAKAQPRRTDSAGDRSTTEMLKQVAEKLKDGGDAPAQTSAAAAKPAAAGSIWDLDDATVAPAPAQETAAQRSPARKRRTKTRLIGFDTSQGDVVDLFKDAPTGPAPVKTTRFPVGWLMVVDGPGRGESFALSSGLSQIGRGDDQSVQLDFGDAAISRQNHAAIVYDPAERSFLLGQGGKSNIVRLNGTPVISNEPVKTGDTIKIGETTLRLVTMCGKDFDW